MPFPARGSFTKLGKGSLFLDLLDEAGVPQGLDFVGNANSIAISAEVTDTELFSSTERSGALIARAVLRTVYTIAVSLNEYTLKNLRLFLKGDDDSAAQAVQSQESVVFSSVKLGKFYETGYRRITNVSVFAGTVGPLVSGVDYTLNSEYGVIEVRRGAGIVEGDDVTVTFEAPALTISKVRLSRKSSAIARLVYLTDDANTQGDSARDRLEVWTVDVAPDGELNLISEDFGAFGLTMALLSDAQNHPDDPFGNLERIGTNLE